MQYEPQQGDIVLLDFDPQTGREQRGTRPALVVSNAAFNRFTNLAMVCPIMSTDNGFPLKSLDLHARNAKRFESVPEDIIEEVADLIAQFVGFPKIR